MDDEEARLRAVGEAQEGIARSVAADAKSSSAASRTTITCRPQFVEEYKYNGTKQVLPGPKDPIVVTVAGAKMHVRVTEEISPVTLDVASDNTNKMIAMKLTADGPMVLTWFKPERALRFAILVSQVGRPNPAPPGVTPGVVSQYQRCEVSK